MSKTIVQPVGQKRLTNVAVVRLNKQGCRFEIACYKNKVLSWRSGVEKDLDEVLQSHTVYSNVSKGVLANSSDLRKAFGNAENICLEILDKGELQVAGKERESQLATQFRDIATIVMQNTINPETHRPYTINMIERLMHGIHFAVDPLCNSKKQALKVIWKLQKDFPIKRSPMRLRLTVPGRAFSSVSEKLNELKSNFVSNEESGDKLSVICEVDPCFYRDCDVMVRNLQGRLEILAISVHAEGETNIDLNDDHVEPPSNLPEPSTQTISEKKADPMGDVKQHRKCITCDAYVCDAKQYREHFKSEWHKHNLRRKIKQLPPLSVEECMGNMEISESKVDLKEYSLRLCYIDTGLCTIKLIIVDMTIVLNSLIFVLEV